LIPSGEHENLFYNSFRTIANDHIPQKTINGRNNPPQLTGEILNVVKKKETLRRKLRRDIRSQVDAIMEKYKSLRRTSKKLIKVSRENVFASMYSKPKRFRSFFKTSTKFCRIPQQVSIATDNIVPSVRITSTNADETADLFNRYFNSVFLKETEEIYRPVSPLSNETMSEITLEPCEVRIVLNNLNPNKASGPDKISIRLLKECACSITPSLTYLFNKSLHTGDLPTEWKLSNIIPLHKKGDKNYVENCRSISLMCAGGKVLERCIYNRLVDHVRKLISDCQHGFVRGKSCTSQLLSMLERIGKNLDMGLQTDILYLDIAKAFDHKLLLHKFHQFGITDKILNWFTSYRIGRQQRMLVHGATSYSLTVISGVPQGSILGPLLFLIHVNDLPPSVSSPSVDVSLFADDTKCFSIIQAP
jgi:hypothetical protein